MNTLSNISFVLKQKNYAAIFAAFSIIFFFLFSLLLELYKLPLLDPQKLQNTIVWELFLPNLLFIMLAAILNALLFSLTIFRLKELQANLKGKEAKTGFLGAGLSSAFAACPFCAISVASIFGASFVANFIAPFYHWFQLFALLIVGLSIYWTSQTIQKECIACNLKMTK